MSSRVDQVNDARRRRWRVLLAWLGIPVVVLVCACVYGEIQAAPAQQKLDAVIAELDVPADWTFVEENRRRPGVAGLCPVSVFDVRRCDEVFLLYSLSEIPSSNRDLEALLPSQLWTPLGGDCADPSLEAGGSTRLCTIGTNINGHEVEARASANIAARVLSAPRVSVMIEAERD